jgi:hypothetical protein
MNIEVMSAGSLDTPQVEVRATAQQDDSPNSEHTEQHVLLRTGRVLVQC